MSFVLDASTVLVWGLDEPDAESAVPVIRSLSTTRAHVPSLWHYEVTNALIMAERRKRLDRKVADKLLDWMLKLPIEVDVTTGDQLAARLIDIARTRGLTTYDSAYVELALRFNIPIATHDAKLRKAAVAAGVEIFEG